MSSLRVEKKTNYVDFLYQFEDKESTMSLRNGRTTPIHTGTINSSWRDIEYIYERNKQETILKVWVLSLRNGTYIEVLERWI